MLILSILIKVNISIAENDGDSGAPSVAEVESAFILNFLKLISPIRLTGDKVVICVSGRTALTSMSSVASRRSNSEQPILVRPSEGATASSCSVFFNSSEESTVKEFRGDPRVLRITTAESSCAEAAHIRFYMKDNRVRFAVNLTQAKKDSMEISSKLLALAEIEKCD